VEEGHTGECRGGTALERGPAVDVGVFDHGEFADELDGSTQEMGGAGVGRVGLRPAVRWM